jgi:hypothetical protein
MPMLAVLLVLIQAATPAPQSSAIPPPATIPAARARIAAGDLEGAAKILDALIAANPQAFRALDLLGTVRQQQQRYDAAIEAYTASLVANSTGQNVAPLYNIAATWALAGDADKAFDALRRAKQDGRVDLSLAAIDPNMASIAADPRLAALLPTRESFAKPFVEDVKILHEYVGEGPNDVFGWIARNIGDVDGDKANDFVTSAPSYTRGAPLASPGRVYVYSSRTHRLLWQADGAGSDSFGTGIEAAGDTNKDGIPDVIASAPGGGYAKVLSGRDGKLLLTLRGESASDGFGAHVSGAGDVDGDGFADVIVGAPSNNAGGQSAGRAYVHSGKDGALLLTLTGERAGDAFGSAVGGGRTKSGFALIVGAARGGARQTGKVYVYDALVEKPKFTFESDETGAALGAMFLSLPGDVDRDGVDDVYATDWMNGAKGPATGRVYVHSGKGGARLHAWTGESAGDGFGTTHGTAGDVDGDGHADLLVGAWQQSSAAIGGGRVYLESGKDGKLLRTYTCRTPFDTFGFDAVTLGDVDGDAIDDFLITSGYSAVRGYHSGRVFVISSGVAKAR